MRRLSLIMVLLAWSVLAHAEDDTIKHFFDETLHDTNAVFSQKAEGRKSLAEVFGDAVEYLFGYHP